MSDPDAQRRLETRSERMVRIWQRADHFIIDMARKAVNADLSGHKPDDLRTLDDLLDEYFQQACEKGGGIDSGVSCAGCYLGEVFVHNLGAVWHYPNAFQGWIANLAVLLGTRREQRISDRLVWVELGGRRIYVLEAAREAVVKTGAVFPLYDFYQTWARVAAPS
jgi:hypothetical protein